MKMNINDDDYSESVLADFAVEVGDLIKEIEGVIDRVGANGLNEAETVLLMRPLHTLKGTAGTVGRHIMGKLAHRMEDLLESSRKVPLAQPALLVDLLYDWTACVSAMSLKKESQIAEGDWRPLFERVEALLILHQGGQEIEGGPTHFPVAVSAEAAPVGRPVDPGFHPLEPEPKNLVQSGKNRPLHFLSMLKGSAAEYSADDILLLSKLPLVQWQVREKSIKEFCAFIGESMQRHGFYRDISRICLVSRVGLSNKLRMLSVFGESIGSEGTSHECFVSPGSSLFQMRAYQFRVYQSAKRMESNYQMAERPPPAGHLAVGATGNEIRVRTPTFF